MDGGTIITARDSRNDEDYDGAVCLLVRELGKRRHARIEVLIDADRLADVTPLDWVIWRSGRGRRVKYAVCMSPLPGMQGWVLGLHRYLMDPPVGMVVDHKSRRRLDNRSKNLRVCTHQQNCFNKGPGANSNGKFKGVSKKTRRRSRLVPHVWLANISVDGKMVRIGSFATARQAAYAYNVFAERHRGEFAYLNDVTLTDEEVAFVHGTIARVEAERQRRKELAERPYEPPPPPRRQVTCAIDLLELLAEEGVFLEESQF